MLQVIIMRGVSGAGKTSWVKKNLPTHRIISADKYHYNEAGVYQHKKENAPEAHNKCLREFLHMLRAYDDPELSSMVVVIDNTNTTMLDLCPYYRLAEALGHPVKIVEIKCDPMIAAARNTHDTPPVVVGAMHNALISERVPNWWNREVYDQEGNLVYRTPSNPGDRTPVRHVQ